MQKKGILFVISAPAGTGKTTLVSKLINENEKCIRIVTTTTRLPRKGEIDGKDYFFVSKEIFDQKVMQKEFLEHAQVFDHDYGSSKSFVFEALNNNKNVFLVIDTQGASQLQGKIPAIFIFIAPPSLEELERRLKKRGTEDEIDLDKRLSHAQKEMAQAKNYDYFIVNDDFDQAYEALYSIIVAEEHRIRG